MISKSVVKMIAMAPLVRKQAKDDLEETERNFVRNEQETSEQYNQELLGKLASAEQALADMASKCRQLESDLRNERTIRGMIEAKVSKLETDLATEETECSNLEGVLSAERVSNAELQGIVVTERSSRLRSDTMLRDAMAMLNNRSTPTIASPVSYRVEITKKDGNGRFSEARFVPEA